MPDTGVLIVGHGSRDAAGNVEFEAVVAAFARAHPEWRVEPCYIELAHPLVADALAAMAATTPRVVVVPLLLFAAGHVKNDLPLAVDEARRRWPAAWFAVAPALGVHPSLVSLAHDRVSACLPEGAAQRARTLLLVVGRGSSDPDANGDLCKVTRLIAEGRGLLHVESAFLGVTTPSVDTALELSARLRPERLVVLPYLLFAGRLVARLSDQVRTFAARHSWIRTHIAPHLGHDARLLALMEERVGQTLSGASPLPCDTCQYRAPLPGLEHQVGGLRALLYSVRHTFTHAQASMPEHTHKALKKHVLVCGNADCVARGSVAVLDALRRDVKASCADRSIKITRTACMGRCGEGPTVAIYPDGVWYRGVRESDAPHIVREHLLRDRLVGHLVDDILQ